MPKREPITKITLADGSTRYRIRVDAGVHLDGKRKQIHRKFTTCLASVAGLADLRTQVARGEFISRQSVTASTYFASWLAGKRKLRPTTRAYYEDVSTPFLDSYGDLLIQHLTKRHFDSAVNTMLTTGGRTGTGRAPSYIRGFLIAWGQCLDMAVAEGIIRSNPARLVERPSMPVPDPVTWTTEQAAVFQTSVKEHPWNALWLLSLAGLRRGEVMGLAWRKVDTEAAKLVIGDDSAPTTRILLDGKVIDSDPKTRRGFRTLPLWPEITEALKELRLRQTRDRLACGGWDTDLVAVHEDGSPINPRHYSDTFQALSKKAGLPVIFLKNARHTSVTLMRNAGVPDHIVASWHGHDESVMRAYYSDGTQHLDQAAEAIRQRSM